ncbi:hypothetical protein [Paenibacillus illinoisensis]|uniref:hypothetical protein n=1 Tax=Paenibacillus illinoisensis TaxID=59845 RepID=UPI001C8D82F5|nr:hypothetical protein [Paenibacillus illinoisensis]MBY0219681.1 hypothetical protein [Paenibacillus illinoisensis]MCM3203909.1 hypothetical protein [Paenibacillus illinoisensis]
MFVFILMIAGAVVSLLVPYGTVIVIGVILGLVVDNYRNTLYIREDIRSIKKHLGLMNNKEAEEYEFEKQWSQQEQLTSDEIRVINKRIEAELEKENRNKKN